MEISTIKLKMKDASLILIFLALLVYINGYEKLFLVLLLVFVIFYFTPSDIMSYFKQKKSILKKVRVVEEVESELEPELEPEQEQEEYQENEYTEQDTESLANTEITIDDDIENDDIQINKISQNNNND